MMHNFRNLSVICFRGLFDNVGARTASLCASRGYVIQHKCAYPNSIPNKCKALSCSNSIKECMRFKSSDKSKKSQRREYESDSDDEEEEMEAYDEEGRPLLRKGGLNSIRLDNILMKVFGLTRRRAEVMLMGNHVLVNDSAAIKSYEIRANDVLELKDPDPSSGAKSKSYKKLEIVKIKPDNYTKTFEVFYVAL